MFSKLLEEIKFRRWLNKFVKEQTEVSCTYCKQIGHVEKDCPVSEIK